MNLDKLSSAITEIVSQAVANAAPSEGHPYEIGKNYFIRTVTMHHTGKLVAVYKNELVLEDAAWIADSGRFADFLTGTEAKEIEPFPNRIIVGRGAIVDACVYEHPLPRKQK